MMAQSQKAYKKLPDQLKKILTGSFYGLWISTACGCLGLSVGMVYVTELADIVWFYICRMEYIDKKMLIC